MFGKAKGFFLWLFGWEEPTRTPEQIIDGHIQEMTVTLGRCKVQVAKLLKERRDLQEKLHRNTNQITNHVREARNAMARNEEEVARDHLRAKQKCDQLGEKLQQQLTFFKNQADKLVDTVRTLEMKLDETKRKKMLLMTQKQCAEAQLLLSSGPGNETEGEGVRELLSDLEEEVLQKQARAMLETEVTTESSQPVPDSDPKDAAAAASIEDELATLKKRLLTRKDEPPDGSPAEITGPEAPGNETPDNEASASPGRKAGRDEPDEPSGDKEGSRGDDILFIK